MRLVLLQDRLQHRFDREVVVQVLLQHLPKAAMTGMVSLCMKLIAFAALY
jgi:hypothetical protein